MWTQQLGATLALFDAGAATMTASGDPSNKRPVAKAMSTLKTVTIDGPIDFTSGPVPNVSPGPIIGSPMGQGARRVEVPARVSRDRERHRSRTFPIQAKLKPFNS